MDKKVLTVCVSIYNHEEFIEQCLDSIINQKTSFDFEIIVGNDCSTDNSAEVLKKYENMATIINRDENVGLVKNLYDMCKRASGKYITEIGGDDYFIDEYAFEKQVEFLEIHKEFYSVAGYWSTLYMDSGEEKRIFSSQNMPSTITLYDFLRNGFCPQTLGMWRNTFSTDENNYLIQGARNNEEMKWEVYILSKGDKYVIPEYIWTYRTSGKNRESYNFTHDIVDVFKDNYIDLCILRKLFKKKYQFKVIIFKRFNYFLLRLESERNYKGIIKLVRLLRLEDLFTFLFFKLYFLINNYQDPDCCNNRSYFIKEK